MHGVISIALNRNIRSLNNAANNSCEIFYLFIHYSRNLYDVRNVISALAFKKGYEMSVGGQIIAYPQGPEALLVPVSKSRCWK